MEAVVGSAAAVPTVEALAVARLTAEASAAAAITAVTAEVTAEALAEVVDRCMDPAAPEAWDMDRRLAAALSAAPPTVAPIALPDGIRSAAPATCLAPDRTV
jgi:hypothetical protein